MRRVFIDGFGGFCAGLIYSDRVQPFAISLANELRRLGVTAVFSEEIAGVFGPELVIPPGAAAVADNILFLRHVELRSQIRRLISVMKIGDHEYETSLREFVITDRGFEVASTFETAELIDGKEMLLEMRSDPNLASVPAILMSAARRQIAIPADEDFPEFSTFLRKPFQLKPLMEAVVALIGPGG